MSLYPLIILDDEAKAGRVWTGVLLGDRVAGDQRVFLYELCGFYIEIYHSIGLNQITELALFKGTSFLEPYLDQISIEESAKPL
jgi:hypothetical protein